MTDALKVLVRHRRRLTVAFYRKARKSEVDAWDFTDMEASGSDSRARVCRPRWIGRATCSRCDAHAVALAKVGHREAVTQSVGHELQSLIHGVTLRPRHRSLPCRSLRDAG